jgi:hypothetical protein
MKFYIEEKTNSYYWRKIKKNKLNAIYGSCFIVWFFKNGKEHNFKNASSFDKRNKYKKFCLNDKYYGDQNDFTKKSWRKLVKMQIFL